MRRDSGIAAALHYVLSMFRAIPRTTSSRLWRATSEVPPNEKETVDRRDGEAAAPRSLRILIVEDEMFVAMDAEAILAAAGHEVVAIVATGDEAVARAAQHCPDVVLMDLRLQGQRDGIDTAAEIRSRFGLPVIFVTANMDPVTHARAMQVAPVALISKPFNSTSLLGALEAIAGPKR